MAGKTIPSATIGELGGDPSRFNGKVIRVKAGMDYVSQRILRLLAPTRTNLMDPKRVDGSRLSRAHAANPDGFSNHGICLGKIPWLG